MDIRKPNLSLIQGGRNEIEQDLIKLVLLTNPVPAAELNRLLSLLEPSSRRASLQTVTPNYLNQDR